FFIKNKYATIAYLSATFGIKWSSRQYYLILYFTFRFYWSVFYYLCSNIQIIVAYKNNFIYIIYYGPITCIYNGSCSRSIFLLLHFFFKTNFIYLYGYFFCHQ